MRIGRPFVDYLARTNSLDRETLDADDTWRPNSSALAPIAELDALRNLRTLSACISRIRGHSLSDREPSTIGRSAICELTPGSSSASSSGRRKELVEPAHLRLELHPLD